VKKVKKTGQCHVCLLNLGGRRIRERRKEERRNVSIVRKGPRGRVDSPVSLLTSIDTCSVAS
jgi:hypothetical protein